MKLTALVQRIPTERRSNSFKTISNEAKFSTSLLTFRMILEVKQLVHELRRITLLWDELWLGTLNQQHPDVSRKLQQLEAEVKKVMNNSSLSKDEKMAIIKEKHRTIMKPVMISLNYSRIKIFQIERFLHLSTVHNYRHSFIYCSGYRQRNLFVFLLIFHHNQLYLRTSFVSVTSPYPFSKNSRCLRCKGTFCFRERKWIIIALNKSIWRHRPHPGCFFRVAHL